MTLKTENTIEPAKRECISENARQLLDNMTIYMDYQTHLTLLKSAIYHLNEYYKELAKAKVGVNALIQIRRQQNQPPVPEDSKLSWTLQRKHDEMSDILKRLDSLILEYDQITDHISAIHELRYVPNGEENLRK